MNLYLIVILLIALESVQSLNEAQLELSEINTDFKTATGYQLDLIGKLVGAERKGRTDSDYRNYILFKILRLHINLWL